MIVFEIGGNVIRVYKVFKVGVIELCLGYLFLFFLLVICVVFLNGKGIIGKCFFR